MTRAELRRQKREEKKEQKTYTFTAKELEDMQKTIRDREYARAKEILSKQTKNVAGDIFRMMLVVPTNVLVADYWEKSAKKRIPKFVNECMKLYNAIMDGTVKMSECVALTEEYSGIELADKGGICEQLAEKVGERYKY